MSRRGVALALILVFVAVACDAKSGGVDHAVRGPAYTVTAIVMQRPGQAPHACAIETLQFPPAGCAGPDVGGLDPALIGGSTRYANGVVATPFLRLVGAWEHGALNLTLPAEHAVPADATPVPVCRPVGQQLGGTAPPLISRVAGDSKLLEAHGIVLIEFGGCNQSLFITVAVADPSTVTFLTDRYGDVQVYGWLKPVK